MKKKDETTGTKKRDKKKFVRHKCSFSNVPLNWIDENEVEAVENCKSAEKSKIEKKQFSTKSNLKLVRGRIVEVKSNYICQVEISGRVHECVLGGRLKNINFETKNLVAVGDYVNVDMSQRSQAEYFLIEEICPREKILVRFPDISYQEEIIIASNIDQVVITSSVSEPGLKWGLIDRYLISCFLMELSPVICINKIDLIVDLGSIKEISSYYESAGIDIVFTSVKTQTGIDRLKKLLKDRDSVFSGHSGVGKTSLINSLQPGLELRVGNISNYTSKGTHTTSSSRLIPWDFGGHLVDTPGIRNFGLNRDHKNKIPRLFPGFGHYSLFCKFNNCTHTHEAECEVKEKVSKKIIKEEIYESYLRIYNSL